MKKGDEKEPIYLEKNFILWSKRHGVNFLRYSLAIIFIWFGFLKFFGASPVAELIANTLTWFNPLFLVFLFGLLEVSIGLSFLWKRMIKVGLFLMFFQMAGTFLPLILLPDITWTGFMVPTFEGQYIIKNLVIVSAAVVVGSHLHIKKVKR